MSIRYLCCLALVNLTLPGCVVPAPSVDERSPAVSGRVVDANTKQPIKGATVALQEHPSYNARTDKAGIYRIRARHNVQLFLVLGICGEEIPWPKYYKASVLSLGHITFYANTHMFDFLLRFVALRLPECIAIPRCGSRQTKDCYGCTRS
jgi:hypothetical protein